MQVERIPLPAFSFVADHDGTMRVYADKGYLCALSLSRHATSPVWQIKETRPSEFLQFVKYLRFEDQERAATFFFALQARCAQICEALPLTQELAYYLDRRAQSLREELQHARNEFIRIQRERYSLLQFARQFNLEDVEYGTETSDGDKAVRALREFKVLVEQNEVPFFSEAALYPLIGKEDARTVLALVDQVCEFVAPHVE